ncbi:MAG: CidA/LrgA family protein [Nocardioides sp.]|nr:CidA/LrgA family protein [Nocardioides sp.]
MRVVHGLTWLLGCQLAGETLAHVTGAPIPGAVLGMVVLLAVLLVRRNDDTSAHAAADAMLPHLQLLFIVPGVGVVAYGSVIAADWLPIVVALVASWVLGLAVVGLSAQALTRWTGRRGARGGAA